MHIVRFQGGFANQLFQLAFYRKLIEKFGEKNVYADLSHYKVINAHGGFKLGEFVKFRIFKGKLVNYENVTEDNYNQIQINTDKNFYYNGYWQNSIFFPRDMSFLNSIFDEEKLENKNREMLSQIDNTDSVSIHVRRGDYVDNYYHGNIANMSYLHNAVQYIENKVSHPTWFIFSDDLSWCRENMNFLPGNVFFIDGNEDAVHKDMFLMSRCKHNIIANSSFSWWAQKLNQNKEKIVISPEYWFNSSAIGLDTEDSVHIPNISLVMEKNANPEFSIIIPVYNTEDSIRRCLSTVLNQSLQNIEIVIVDDGSTDGSLRILEEYELRDRRIILIKKEKNESLLSARIAGMMNASGKYMLFVDSDDYIDLDMCKKLSDHLNNNPVDILEYAYVMEPSKEIVCSEASDLDRQGILSMLDKVFRIEYAHTIWNKCYSKKLIKKFLSLADDFYCNMTEDMYFTVIFLSLANSYSIKNDILYHYVNSGGMSTSDDSIVGNVDKIVKSLAEKNKYLREYLQKDYSDLLQLEELYEKSEITFLVDICKRSNRSVYDKISALRILDSVKGTKYSDEYEKRHGWFDEFIKSGKKHKIKMIIKELLKKGKCEDDYNVFFKF